MPMVSHSRCKSQWVFDYWEIDRILTLVLVVFRDCCACGPSLVDVNRGYMLSRL